MKILPVKVMIEDDLPNMKFFESLRDLAMNLFQKTILDPLVGTMCNIPVLVSLLNSPDTDVQYYFTTALSNIAVDGQC